MTAVPLVIEPDPDDPEGASVLVDGEIDGRPYRFILDTGAARTHVVADTFLDTLPVHDRHDSAGVLASRNDDVVLLPSVTLGPITVTDLAAVRVPAHPDRHHLLGMDALGGVTLRFDFGNATLDVAPTGTLPTHLPLDRSPRGHPFIDVTWPGATARGCWDSGASITVVDAAYCAAHPEVFEPDGTSRGVDATGAAVETDMYRMAACRIGDLNIAVQRVAVVDLPQANGRMDMVIGYPTLAQAVWTFDFPANRWAAIAVQ